MSAVCPECGGPKARRDTVLCSRKCLSAQRRRQTPPCKIDGCNRPHHSLGLCDKHYQRQRQHGETSSPRDLSVADRFWQKVDRTDSTGCWLWTGPKNNKGYGRFDVYADGGHVRRLAHRMVLELEGVVLTRGDVVMHTCDHPPCVNPAHLRVGTQLDNMRDCLAKGRMNLSGLEFGRRAPAKCGTTSGYARHCARKEPKCEPCRQASREYGREYYRRRRGEAA